METEFNYYWGSLGILGLLGYVLENPIYYVFFAFFLFFLVPVFNKSRKGSEENSKSKFSNYDMYNISIWFGSAALLLSGVILMATKTMSDLLAVIMLLGIIALMTNFFNYVGMDEKARDERLRKIGTFAATYSWYITLVFVTFLVINMYWGQNIHNPIELMGVTIVVMVSTMLIANTVLSRRGDIE